jgi:phytoene dehydrogenase-like protein
MEKINEFIIIGGGASGMATSALLKSKGKESLLLEAHQLLGGSASYFIRSQYSFDVGATTFSGIKNNGPLKKFLNQINLNLPFIKIDPGLIILNEQLKLERFSDLEKYTNELIKKFPTINSKILSEYLIKEEEIETLAWLAISNNFLPVRKFNQLFKLLKISNLKLLPLIPLLLKSYEQLLPIELNENQDFKNYLNELLFITAQNNCSDTPGLFGILGAQYPNDTYYLNGGMRTFFSKVQEKCSEIKTNTEVISISKINKVFEVKTRNSVFYANNIISTIPQKNNQIILGLGTDSTNEDETWSAFTLYFTVPDTIKIDSLFYQIHVAPIKHIQTKSFFVSFSHPHDLERNVKHRQTVTISTHALPSLFKNLSKENYEYYKFEIGHSILATFLEHFNLNKNEIENLEIGTPRTFERYTRRINGSVGGLGHHLNNNLKDYLFINEPIKNFYSIGDTTFPGQGIASVIYSALNLTNYLYPNN